VLIKVNHKKRLKVPKGNKEQPVHTGLYLVRKRDKSGWIVSFLFYGQTKRLSDGLKLLSDVFH
jgi:hypothetical protein